MKIQNKWMVVGAALLLGACATKSGTGALVGGGAGAGVGAGIGALAGGKKGAAIGAVVGGIAGTATGGAIGARMDRQQKALEENVKNAEIERQGNEIKVKFDSGILFSTGSASLKPAAQTTLEDFASILKEYNDTTVSIEGHTDSTGSKSTNIALSANRANSVKSYLSQKGVGPTRMTTVGYADDQPIATNDTAEGRAQNRRVEVKINPITAE
ncbi:MAG: OmpA family protein [Bdellovibrionales bacterium]|nr:OmpA family protein [Bdellovibrionales bacterium]